MARFLVMSTAEKGHLNPLVGVAQWLERLGHELVWLCIPAPAEQLSLLGFQAIGLDGDAPPHVTSGPELARLVRSGDGLRRWIRSLLLDAVPSQIEPVRAVLRDVRPAALALDPMLYQGVIAAHLEGIPWLGVSSSLNPVTPRDLDCELVRTNGWLADDRARLFAEHGLAPSFRVCDCLSPFGTTVFATDAYVGSIADVQPRTWLVGPSIPPGPRGDEVDLPAAALPVGRPLVYCSFGSQISWQPELFTKVAHAAAQVGCSLVCSAGELADTEWARALPGDVRVLPYAPQRAILGRASAFVTHGGANSVMEALCAGVPLLVTPICNDQFIQARFVEASGVGESLDLHTAPVSAVAAALARLVEPTGAVRAALGEVCRSYQAADGARAVAERLVALA